MAQETWALKLDGELKEKLQNIIKEDFDSSKDFMENLVNLYELNKLKQGENVLAPEVDELESLTRRMNNIFINANAKMNTMLLDKDTKAEQQQELNRKLIEQLQNNITALETEREQISGINDSLVSSNEDYKEQVNQLTKANQTLEELVAGYKEKNDLLTGTLTEYKAEHEVNKDLQEQNRELQDRVHELTVTSKEQVKQITESDKKLQEQEQRHNNQLQELRVKHEDELDTMKKRAELNESVKLMNQQQDFQARIQELQEKHNAEIEAYQAKYKELLERMEQEKKAFKISKKDLLHGKTGVDKS